MALGGGRGDSYRIGRASGIEERIAPVDERGRELRRGGERASEGVAGCIDVARRRASKSERVPRVLVLGRERHRALERRDGRRRLAALHEGDAERDLDRWIDRHRRAGVGERARGLLRAREAKQDLAQHREAVGARSEARNRVAECALCGDDVAALQCGERFGVEAQGGVGLGGHRVIGG